MITNLTKHVARVHTTSRMVVPLRQLIEAGCRTSEEKDRTNQTRFGMGSEILSTQIDKPKMKMTTEIKMEPKRKMT